MPPDRPSGRTTAEIADHNSRALLETLRRSGPLTRTDLSARLGLSIPGITNVAQRLLDEALIVETKRRARGASLPSAQYALDPAGALAIGMRSQKGWTHAVLIDVGGTIRARAVARGPAAVTEKLLAEVSGRRNILGVGVAADGPQAELQPTLVSPLVAAVLAEWLHDPAAASRGIAAILIEEKIRAGLFFHGRPFAGVHQRAGRIGEMLTGNDRRPLDEVASMAAYRQLSGAAAHRRWIDDAARHLLDAIFALTGFLRPAQVTIGGDLPREAA